MLREGLVAVRSLARRRGLAAAVILTLTLGIGANSAIFSAVDAVLLKPLPYPDAGRLMAVYEAQVSRNDLTSLVAPVRLEEWHRLNRTFDGLAGSYFENVTDTTGPLPERVVAMRTSPRFFTVLGTPPTLGRTFTPDEERFGGPAVVVVSDTFWRTHFGADPAAVGRTLVLNNQRRTIVGIMPSSFRYPSATTEAWIPAQMGARLLESRGARFFTAVGRLKPGVTPEQAREDLNVVQARLGAEFPKTDAGWSATVIPLKEEQVGGVRRSLWLLFGAVLLVLLAACGNIACLLLVDAARREHEVAVRFSLGASRGRVVRQLLFEGLVLSLIGSLCGLLVARWGIGALRSAATQLPRAAELTMDWRLIVFTLTLAVLTTMTFALAPALQATRRGVAGRLAQGGRGHVGGRQWLPRALVAAQVMLAVVLLVGAGLLIRSFSRLSEVSTGFDASGVLTFRISAGWNEPWGDVAVRQQRTLERLMALPGVTSAALDTHLPTRAKWPPTELRIVGRERAEPVYAVVRQVSAGYFRTLRIPLPQGESCRDDPRDRWQSKAIVNRAFAERHLPGENPVGRQIAGDSTIRTIVGVAADVREWGPSTPPEPTMYKCGLMGFWPDPYYVVRTDPSRGVTMTAIREAVREIEPRRSVYDAATLNGRLSELLSQPRLNTRLLALFAATALLLAAVGLYGMLAQFVSQRRREIGLRMALGARPGQILGQVARHGAAIVGAGVTLGLAAALVLSRFMTTLVFGIDARDPLTFVLVPLALAAIAALATLVPARRAARVDPMQALRDE